MDYVKSHLYSHLGSMHREYLQHFDHEDIVDQLLPDGLVLLGYCGSIAHGLYCNDDIDLMGVFIPPLDHYFGFRHQEHHVAQVKRYDAVSYELRKCVGLLASANPNVLSLLWLEPTHYVHLNVTGRQLIAQRQLFMSKKLFYSFTGYAHDQLQRMTRFGVNGQMGQKRKALVERYGYDTKNASHLIRLLRMSVECLNTGILQVYRPDVSELLDIKCGCWTLEKIQQTANQLLQEAKSAYLASELPEQPDMDAINSFVVSLLRQHYGMMTIK